MHIIENTSVLYYEIGTEMHCCSARGQVDGKSEEDVAEGIRKEVRILQKLDHPHIVRYLASFTVASAVYIVMECARARGSR